MKNNYFILYCSIACLLIGNIAANSYAKEKSINLYIDADFASHLSSSTAIEQGIMTALSEVGNKLDGYSVNIVKLNHRGNSRRSLGNIKKYLADDQALAIFAGLHSPPLLANLKFINTQGALVLVPWAAAGPITRFSGGTNWVFRLSIDDSKAGEVLVGYAVEKKFKKKNQHFYWKIPAGENLMQKPWVRLLKKER